MSSDSTDKQTIADFWGTGDIFGRIYSAMEAAGLPADRPTIEQLAPVDHYHARGMAATVEMADVLPVQAGQHIVDIGCGLGGPARYFADRFGCRVSGVDITVPFVDAANKLTSLLDMTDQVEIKVGDGEKLPYPDATFDGGYSQHVTMNVPDREQFFGEAFRVLKPGAYFALSEHGLGTGGDPHYPAPWSEDGSGAFLCAPDRTMRFLENAGFTDIAMEDTGTKYLAGYRHVMELASKGALPSFGLHILVGESGPQRIRNAARNIEEDRTRPLVVTCRKPD